MKAKGIKFKIVYEDEEERKADDPGQNMIATDNRRLL